MIDVSWKVFQAKFAGKEYDSFQELCLFVFCHHCSIQSGIFSYGNHPGIETEDVLFEGKYTGFQAKFYTDNLPNKKKDILDAIIATRNHNTRVQKIIFFLPIDPPSVSKGVDEGQKPKWMKEAEATAKENHLEIDWFGTSRFQTALACEDLQFVARHFFDHNPDLWDCLAALKGKTDSRLAIIRDAIRFQGKSIHFEHRYELDRLDELKPSSITIISGIGGVGKTAIVKDWFKQFVSERTCSFVLQPDEVIEFFNDIDMSKAWHATLDTFISMTTRMYERRVLVVDSAEKMGKELSELLMVLHRFLDADWQIVLTTRTIFEKQIVSHFQSFLPEVNLEVLKVSPVDENELEVLSSKYGFLLPANHQVRDAIRTAFNLSAYLLCNQPNEATSLKRFQEIVWAHFVMNDDPTDTAGQSFCRYVEEKLKKETKFLVIQSPSEDTQRLEQRGIIQQRKNATGYVITHDIYEEWAAVRVLDGKLQELGLSEFERYVASSHGLRHGFQLQIEQHLAGMEKDADPFLTPLLATKSDALRSDLIVASLRSEHIGKFLKVYATQLLEKGSSIFEKIVAAAYSFGRGTEKVPLLFDRQRPDGPSWRAIIGFAYTHQAALQEIETPTLLPLMTDWALSNPNDEATGTCFLFAWNAVELGEPARAYSYQWEERLADLILATSISDKKMFEAKIQQHILKERDRRNDVIDEVCKRLLCNPISGPCYVVIKAFPRLVRDVAWAYWRPKRKPQEHCYEIAKIEFEYGLAKYGFDYFPPSAYQGPTYWLLHADPLETIPFIIDFTNACVDDAIRDKPNRFDNIVLTMPTGKKVGQKISFGLWDCYRDKKFGEPVPELLNAIHMALEKYLLELAADCKNNEFVEGLLWIILCRSKSASLTAVVASIVMAHPMEFVKVGLVLISERKVLLCDSYRLFAEYQPDLSSVILPLPKRTHDYFREEADKHPVRKVSLENVIWQYQIIKSEVVPDLKERVQKVLDGFGVDWEHLSHEDKCWLTRIDVRRQNIHLNVDNKTRQAIISPEPILSPDMQMRQKKNDEFLADKSRMIKLAQWGDKRFRDQLPKADDEYSDINNVLKDFDWLLSKTNAVVNNLDVVSMTAHRATAAALIMFYYETMPHRLQYACMRILLASLDLVFSDDYSPVKWDRVKESIFAIPYLLPHLSWRERRHVKQRFIMALLDEKETGFLGGERICDWGMAGIRVYCERKGEKSLRKWAMTSYRRHFLRYQSYMRRLRAPRDSSLMWRTRVILRKILTSLHVRTPSCFLPNDWMAPMNRLTCRNSLSAYAKSLVERHRLLIRPTERDLSHLKCNQISFYFPTKLDEKDELAIVSDVKNVLDFLFCTENKKGGMGEHLYLSQMGQAYLKLLGYCALNMSTNGSAVLLFEFGKSPQAFQRPELLDRLLVAQYEQQRMENFWRLWNGVLPIVAVALEKDPCRHQDSQQVLDVMALNPLYGVGDELVWNGSDTALVAFFDSLVAQCGCHRHLAVSVMKFTNGVGKRFLHHSLKWIDQIILRSQDEYDYHGNNAKNITKHFEHLVPLINKRMESLISDMETRKHLISILDYLVAHNSLSAFQMRETLYAQSVW